MDGIILLIQNIKKCVKLLLRGQLFQLVERHLIPAKILSDEHINNFFDGEFTIRNIIIFFKHS